jgi:hypothetical protein
MSQSNSTTIAQAGKITVKVDKRGKIKLYGHNFQRGNKQRHFGSILGRRYEKPAQLYRRLQSFCLTESEFGAVQASGAEVITIICDGTYAISVSDFDKYKVDFYDPGYGPQWAVHVSKFQYSSKIQKRNAILDNPPVATVRDIVQDRQMSLFGGMK